MHKESMSMKVFTRIRARVKAWFDRADKSVLTNVAFLVAISLSAVLLISVTAFSWWSDNLAPSVTVGSRSISVSEMKQRGALSLFRIGVEERRIRARVAAGTLPSTSADAQIQSLQEKADNINNSLTSDAIDMLLVAQLADDKGVSVSDDAINAAWLDETTLPELRLLRRMSIDFSPSGDGSAEAAAKEKAEAILKELDGGASFSELAKRESTDSYAEEGGRIGWSSKDEDPLTDDGYAAAWNLPSTGATEPILRSDGQYVIFFVEQIRPGEEDKDLLVNAADANINIDFYKQVIAESVLRDELSAVVTETLVAGPVEQRDVSYVSVPVTPNGGEADEVQVRHVLYSPNDDPDAARALDPTDPAWVAAKAEADAALKQLREGKATFKTLAKTTDDNSSKGADGLLDWAAKGAYAPAFDDAVWQPDLVTGDILDVVQTEYGFHVIQFAGRRTGIKLQFEVIAESLKSAPDFLAAAKEATADYRNVEIANVGFISRYTVNPDLSEAVWGLAAGDVSSVQTLNDTLVIVKVNAVESKPLTDEQNTALKENGFEIWLAIQQRHVEIAIEGQVVQEASALIP